jgi:hypothetical protein
MPIERFQAPRRGTALRVAPLAVEKDQAYELENLLTDRPGKVVVRGPFGPAEEVYTTANNYYSSYWRFDENVMVGDKHVQRVASDNFGVNSVAGIVTANTITTRSTRVGDYAYGIGIKSFGSAFGSVLQWDGTAAAPTQQSNCPYQAADVCSHLERLFTGGGRTPGTGPASTAYPLNKLHWTDVGGPVAGTLAEWQDDVSGLVNEIQVGSAGDPIVALASLPRQLVIFKANSIYVALGDSPSSFTLRRVLNSSGCLNARSVLVSDDRCFFVNSDGYLMLYDGASFTSLGGPRWFGDATNIVRLANDYYLMHGDVEALALSETWLVHLPTQAWSKVTMSTNIIYGALSAANPRMLLSTETGKPMIFDGQHIRCIDVLTSATDAELTARESIATDPATYELIAGKITTRLSRLTEPLTRTVVRRVYVDHQTQSDGVGSALPEWFVTVKDAAGTIKGSFTIPAAAASTSIRATTEQDVLVESAEAMVTMEYQSDAAPAESAFAEVHDIWLEHEQAQRF